MSFTRRDCEPPRNPVPGGLLARRSTMPRSRHAPRCSWPVPSVACDTIRTLAALLDVDAQDSVGVALASCPLDPRI